VRSCWRCNGGGFPSSSSALEELKKQTKVREAVTTMPGSGEWNESAGFHCESLGE
jgi:hypothetical protein